MLNIMCATFEGSHREEFSSRSSKQLLLMINDGLHVPRTIQSFRNKNKVLELIIHSGGKKLSPSGEEGNLGWP